MMTIMLESEKEKMIEEWSNILQIAGATVVNKLHSRRDTGKMSILLSGPFLWNMIKFLTILFSNHL